jgi:hypothetical protein
MLGLLGKVFGRTFEDIREDWRKLHKENHHNMCVLSLVGCQIKKAEMGGIYDTYIIVEENVIRIHFAQKRGSCLIVNTGVRFCVQRISDRMLIKWGWF